MALTWPSCSAEQYPDRRWPVLTATVTATWTDRGAPNATDRRPDRPRRAAQPPHRRSDPHPSDGGNFAKPPANAPATDDLQRPPAKHGSSPRRATRPRPSSPRSKLGSNSLYKDQERPSYAGPRARATAVPPPRARPPRPCRHSQASRPRPTGRGRCDPFTSHPPHVVPGIDAAPLRGTPPSPHLPCRRDLGADGRVFIDICLYPPTL